MAFPLVVSAIILLILLILLYKRSREDKKAQEIANKINNFSKKLFDADSLYELFTIHKEIWESGLKHYCIGPNDTFRTEDILSMLPEEVFLNANPLPYWEDNFKKSSFEYNSVFMQYQQILLNHLIHYAK